MKKTLLTILSLTLLLPHHSFAMQNEQSNKISQEKIKITVGSGNIYPDPYGTNVQPSTANQENRFNNLQPTEISSLLGQIKTYETDKKEQQNRYYEAHKKRCGGLEKLYNLIKKDPCLSLGQVTGACCGLICAVATCTLIFVLSELAFKRRGL